MTNDHFFCYDIMKLCLKDEMGRLPPLECLRVFEAAARHSSFSKAADELYVTPAAVAYRIKTLEGFLGVQLFTRHYRGVRLNEQGVEYQRDIQRLLNELSEATHRLWARSGKKHLRITTIQVFAEKWLMPKLGAFKQIDPRISLDVETEHIDVDLARLDADVWIASSKGEHGGYISELLFEETMFPVCSPALLEAGPVPGRPCDLGDHTLLYDLHWKDDWTRWFEYFAESVPDLSEGSGFRLYSMLIQAAVNGMGFAMGHSAMIQQELESGALVAPFREKIAAPLHYYLVMTGASVKKPEVCAFRKWIKEEVAALETQGAQKKERPFHS